MQSGRDETHHSAARADMKTFLLLPDDKTSFMHLGSRMHNIVRVHQIRNAKLHAKKTAAVENLYGRLF